MMQSMIITVNGVKYSKVVLDEFMETFQIYECHYYGSFSYENGWTYEKEYALGEYGTINYESSYEEVAQLSGVPLYEVAVRYLNGRTFSTFENDNDSWERWNH